MDKKLKNLMMKYYKAFLLVEENSKRLVNGSLSGEEASERMKWFYEVGNELFTKENCLNNINAPAVLKKYFLARQEDKICSTCWLAASPLKQHKKCSKNIEKFFSTRDSLIKFISKME